MQTTDTVLMVKPARFTYNTQTAGNNAFQEKGHAGQAQEKALEEFNQYVLLLRQAGVEVIVVEDTPEPHTPDSIFPNNWFSTHSPEELPAGSATLPGKGSTLVLYPMFAPNRRLEREKKVLDTLSGYHPDGFFQIIDLTYFEKEEKFLEGTGSLILDRENKIAYGCLSPRTSEEVLEIWAERLDYDYCLFEACDKNGTSVYHTNVMMSIGTKYAVVCLDAVRNLGEREHLIELLEETGKEIIEISLEQMNHFAGNMLELQGRQASGKPQPVMVMSATAKASLDEEQLFQLQRHARIVAPELDSIEKNGGGSARCMIAEIF